MAENRKKKSRRSEHKRKAEQNKKAILLIAGLVFCALIVITGINVMFRMTIRRYDPDIIISGVTVGGTDVSGMNASQAEAAVKKAAEDYASDSIIMLELDGERRTETALSDLGMYAADLDSVIRKAVDYGKKGNPLTCYKILKSAEKNENEKDFPVKYEVSEESAGSALEEKLAGMLRAPEDAKLTQSGGETVITEDVPGEKTDIKKTVENINRLIADERENRDTKGEAGKMRAGASAAAAVKEDAADITAEDLAGLTDVLGTFSTYYGESGDGRTLNVESGANHIGGTLVQPGEEVSADDLMAPYTEENGYAMAASYENNEVVESMGGGICQVSTTLYNALLLAELEITERYEHSMLVSYVEPSMDAAIADDVKDLKFKNNKEDPIYIEAVLSDGNIGFNIYGKETRAENRSIEFESETIETTESDEIRYVATDDYIGEMYTSSSSQEGLTAQLWKIVYEDGEEVSREVFNTSHYEKSDQIIEVGTASASGDVLKALQDAIASQDQAKINAAVSQAASAGGQSQEQTQTEG